MLRQLQLIGWGIILLLMLSLILGTLLNAKAITSITVLLKHGAEEPNDFILPGMNPTAKGPDYHLLIRSGRQWVDCGIKMDTPATNGLTYPVKKPVSLRTAAEIVLKEYDKVKTDQLIERVQIGGTLIEGKNYVFELHTQYRLEVGLDWFFATPIGRAIASGITIALIFIVIVIFLHQYH